MGVWKRIHKIQQVSMITTPTFDNNLKYKTLTLFLSLRKGEGRGEGCLVFEI